MTAAQPLPSSRSLSPPPLEPTLAAAPYEVRAIGDDRGLFATRRIATGTILFGEDDWVDEAERKSFSILPVQRLAALSGLARETFLRFAYNVGPDQVTGTFHPGQVRHPVNFINHSCDPNIGYNGVSHIVALSTIQAGAEIRMDYGTYSFSFDHTFTCRCGATWCRGAVRQDDWRQLVRAGLSLPGFMRQQAQRALWSD